MVAARSSGDDLAVGPRCVAVVVDRDVPRGPVVPQHEVADRPAEPGLVLRLRGVLGQVVDEGSPLARG